MPARVLLVDDHVMLRQGLRKLLETQTDFDVVGEADTASQTFDLAAASQPQVVVLSLGTGPATALDTVHRLRDGYADVRICNPGE
jgi:DNA-binding NarL/FixJ family response regulator